MIIHLIFKLTNIVKYLYIPTVKPGKIRNFQDGKKKNLIKIIINCHNDSGKLEKFSRSQMEKRTSPLDSSH